MKTTNIQNVTISLLSGLALSCLSLNTAIQPAQAGILDDIRSTLGDVTKTIETVKDIHTSAVGLGQKLGIINTQSTDLLDIYSDWFKSLSPANKNIIGTLLGEYAEDKQLVKVHGGRKEEEKLVL
jgi:hypothetical protein